MKYVLLSVLIIALGMTGCAQMALRGGVGSAPEARDMALVGFNDLQNRSAYQPVIHRPGRPLHRGYRPSRRHGAQFFNRQS
jgi:hypothetical protein